MVGRRRVRAHPDWFFSGFQEGIILWHLSEDESSWQPQVLDLHRGTVRALSIHPPGQGFVSSGDEGWLCYWQQTQPQQLLQGAQEYFTTLACTPREPIWPPGAPKGNSGVDNPVKEYVHGRMLLRV
ncbi:MAG: hypothetical protein ACK4HM_06040 [Thermosynechococcus sp.]